MAANALVQTRIDGTVKEEAATVLAAMGLTVSDAVRLMLTRVAREKALPFEHAGAERDHDRRDEGGPQGQGQGQGQAFRHGRRSDGGAECGWLIGGCSRSVEPRYRCEPFLQFPFALRR